MKSGKPNPVALLYKIIIVLSSIVALAALVIAVVFVVEQTLGCDASAYSPGYDIAECADGASTTLVFERIGRLLALPAVLWIAVLGLRAFVRRIPK